MFKTFVIVAVVLLAGCASLKDRVQDLQATAQKEIQKCAGDEACRQKVVDALQKAMQELAKNAS